MHFGMKPKSVKLTVRDDLNHMKDYKQTLVKKL